MPARGQHGSKAPASRKAAALYLDEGIEIELLCERFGIGRGAIWGAINRLRKERAEQQPGGAP